MFSLENKVALVTGASRGIGKAIALGLGNAGATVIGTATSDAGATSISNYLKEANITGSGLTLNVNDDESIKQAIDKITTDYGAVAILINNAGITRDNILLRMKDDEWNDIINTNLTSVCKMSKACLKGMTKARFGRIVNISSVVGATGNVGQSNYAAAKAGVIGFSKSLAREIGSRSITVNVVAPGFIDTDMTRELTDDQRQTLTKQIPVNRLGSVDEIASAVLFLASDEAAYITGETLHINGGMHMG